MKQHRVITFVYTLALVASVGGAFQTQYHRHHHYHPLSFQQNTYNNNNNNNNNVNQKNMMIRSSTSRSSSSSSSTQLYGIPKMFRWLTDQFPQINTNLQNSDKTTADCLYLDMNGIIHPATHNNASGVVKLEETQMYQRIFQYINLLFYLMKPTKVFYLAVDGVAPRAKMNQQRSRRFRSGKENEANLAKLVAEGGDFSKEEVFDSNCITPGTSFMLKLNLALHKWVEFKIANDPAWSKYVQNGGQVIISGPDVAGEGEHKVMDYVREFQASENYKPGLRHCLYGLDADLIMLGLVTGEDNFCLLREKMSVVMGGRRGKPKDMLTYTTHDFELLQLNTLRQMFQVQFRKFSDWNTEVSPADRNAFVAAPKQRGRVRRRATLDPNSEHLNQFKDALLDTIKKQKVPEKYEISRVIDDFVFMSMFVGNDFLTHMPHMEIDSGALSIMLSSYVDLLPKFGGYLTKKEKIHLERLDVFLKILGFFEPDHFVRRVREENWPVNEEYTYKDYYYEKKLDIPPESIIGSTENEAAKRGVIKSYFEGLHWVLNYYHHGCQDWSWFYPYLYSPLCSDMVHLKEFYNDEDIDEDGYATMRFDTECEPIEPLMQLLSVLPPQSASLLPECYAELMLHPSSPLAQFYPRDFTTDPNGKRQTWEAVVKIPFIEASLLEETVRQVHDKEGQSLLTNVEIMQNRRGTPKTFGDGQKKSAFVANGEGSAAVVSAAKKRKATGGAAGASTASSRGRKKKAN